MTKNEIQKSLEEFTGAAFISRIQLAKALGYKDPHNVDDILNGLDRIGMRYSIADVTKAIMRRKEAK